MGKNMRGGSYYQSDASKWALQVIASSGDSLTNDLR